MIVILNGTSSSGKTALARALQARWPTPLLHLGTDSMLQMLPTSYVGMKPSASDGVEFVNDTDDRGPIVRVRSGPVGKSLEASFARSVRVLAEDGHDVVLDVVLFDQGSLPAYVRALRGHPTYLIGVHCETAVLEARELARGDRFQNLARAQLSAVHEFREYYDLDLETTSSSPHELAQSILDFVAKHPDPDAISRLHAISSRLLDLPPPPRSQRNESETD